MPAKVRISAHVDHETYRVLYDLKPEYEALTQQKLKNSAWWNFCLLLSRKPVKEFIKSLKLKKGREMSRNR